MPLIFQSVMPFNCLFNHENILEQLNRNNYPSGTLGEDLKSKPLQMNSIGQLQKIIFGCLPRLS